MANAPRQGRRQINVDTMASLRVENLSRRTSPEDLRRIFSKYGSLGDVHVPRDKLNTEFNKGFAIVRYYSLKDAEDALECVDGCKLDGQVLQVSMMQLPRSGRSLDT